MREQLRVQKEVQLARAATLGVALEALEGEAYQDEVILDHVTKFRAEVQHLRDTAENGIDRKEAERFVREILFLPSEQRCAVIREAIDGMIEEDFDLLWNFVEVVSSMNFFEMIVGERFKEQSAKDSGLRLADTLLEKSDWLIPIELDNDFFHTTIGYAQEHLPMKGQKNVDDDEMKKRREFHRYLFGKVRANTKNGSVEDTEHLGLNGAAIPEIFPKIREFERSVTAFLESGGTNQMRNFSSLTEVFKQLGTDLYGDRMEAFYTRGTTSAFEGLILRVLNYYRNISLIATDHEYSSLWRKLAKEKAHVVNIPGGIDGAEKDMVAAMLAKGEEVMQARSVCQSIIQDVRGAFGDDLRLPVLEEAMTGLDDPDQPIILLISSVPRMGGRKFDMEEIERLIDAENERRGAKLYHLWTDASQDSRIIRSGDVIFRSKKDSSTGGGQGLMDTMTYPPEKGDIPEALRTRGGYNASYIPQLIGSTLAVKARTGHSYGDLLHSGSLWHLKGKGTFLGREIREAQKMLANDRVLKGLFTLHSSLPPLQEGEETYPDNDNNQWRIDSIMRFCPTDEALELLDMDRFKADLRKLRVNFSDFDLSRREMETTEALGYSALMELADADEFNLEEFIMEVERFETWYQSWIVKSLLPSERRNDPEYVRAHFKQAVRDHNYMRILMVAIRKPGHLRRLLNKVKKVVKVQLENPTSS